MYYRSKLGAGLLSALAMLFAFSATEAHAITYTATEVIEDALGYDFFARNLRRTRTDSTGTVVENSDSTIVSENNVDGDFGYYNLSNVSYSHNLNWITPEAGTFLHASLTIYAYGVDGDNDQVYVDQINIGALNGDGNWIFEGFTTTVFETSNPITLALLLSDGILNVAIQKSTLDAFSVYRSDLSVDYQEVPEPASMLLLGLGSLSAGFLRRKMAA